MQQFTVRPAALTRHIPLQLAQPYAQSYARRRRSRSRGSPAPQSGATIVNASYRPASNQSLSTAYPHPALSRAQLDQLRPRVQNVIRALRNMPPGAAERQIASGRYSNLSARELEVVRYAAGLPGRP